MAFTFANALSDVQPALALGAAVEAAYKALPPVASRKLSDYTTFAAVILNAAGPLADAVEAQVKGVAPVVAA